jgi:hypothetical protein
VRWCTAEAPPPRLAYNGADLAYPGLSRRMWWRLFALLYWRGLVADPCARRMARHLARCADDRGRITGLPEVISTYLARHHLRSAQVFWTDLSRLVDRGLVRQLQGSAPGYPARYQLSFSSSAVPPSLPTDLATTLRRVARLLPADAVPAEPADPMVEELITTKSGALCGGLDLSPFFRRGSPLTPQPNVPSRHHQDNHGGFSSKERDQALSVLSACKAEWQLQRGPEQQLTAAQLEHLALPVVLALREVPPSEVRQTLTWQVRSARDLAGVLAWRLGRLRTAARPPARQVAADEHGDRWAGWMAARAAAYASRSPAARAAIAEARAALEQIRTRDCGSRRIPASSPTLVTAPPPLREDALTGPLPHHDQKASPSRAP